MKTDEYFLGPRAFLSENIVQVLFNRTNGKAGQYLTENPTQKIRSILWKDVTLDMHFLRLLFIWA